MIRIRPTKSEGAAKDETRRRATRIEQAKEEQQDEKTHDKTQRLSKWETSTFRPINEGYELAMSEDVVLPTDDWKTESGDIQLAILASLGLLDDYEAEEADITLNSLPRNEDLYTIRYKHEKKKTNLPRGPEIVLDDDTDWELVLRSPSVGSMDWIMLEE